jgi:hypothetical protein
MENTQGVYIGQNTLIDIGDKNNKQFRKYNNNFLSDKTNRNNNQPVIPLQSEPIMNNQPVIPLQSKPIMNNQPVIPLQSEPIINNQPVIPLQNETTINNKETDIPLQSEPIINNQPVIPLQSEPIINNKELDMPQKRPLEEFKETMMKKYNEQQQRNIDIEKQQLNNNKNQPLNTPRSTEQKKPFTRVSYEKIPEYEKNKFLNELSIIFQRTKANNQYIRNNYIILKDKLLDIMKNIRKENISIYGIRYDFTNFVTYVKGKTEPGWPSRKPFEDIIKILLTDSLKDKIGHFQKLMTDNKRNNVILFSIMNNVDDETDFTSALTGSYKSKFGGKKKTKKIKNSKKKLVINKTRSTKTYKPIKRRSIKKSTKNITRRI